MTRLCTTEGLTEDQSEILKAVRAFARAQRRDIANPERLTKLRRSMARIKLVLSERAHQMEEGEQRAALKRMIDAM